MPWCQNCPERENWRVKSYSRRPQIWMCGHETTLSTRKKMDRLHKRSIFHALSALHALCFVKQWVQCNNFEVTKANSALYDTCRKTAEENLPKLTGRDILDGNSVKTMSLLITRIFFRLPLKFRLISSLQCEPI